MKLFEVGEPLCGALQAGLLTVYSFAEELFCADLLRGFFWYQYLGVEKVGSTTYLAPYS